jgi:hypothetical protein
MVLKALSASGRRYADAKVLVVSQVKVEFILFCIHIYISLNFVYATNAQQKTYTHATNTS